MTDPAFFRAPDAPPDPAPRPGDAPAGLLDPPHAASHPTGTQLWLHRISVFLFVLISAVAGVLLIILPWTPDGPTITC